MVEFDWDEHNIARVRRHGLEPDDVEEAFEDPERRSTSARQPDRSERRYGLTGRTEAGRLITAYFVRRHLKIRVITARDADVSERRSYRQGR